MKLDNINESDFKNFYANNSISETAKHFDISIYYVEKLIKKFNLEKHASSDAIKFGLTRSRTNIIEKDELIELYKTKTLGQICNILSISRPTLNKLLDEYNIAKHSQAEAIQIGVNALYGVANVMKLESSKENLKNTVLEKYGSEYFFSSDYGKNSIKDTLLSKYGVEHSSQIPESRQKAVKTSKERYGDDYNHRSKAQETMEKLYGKKHALQTSIFLDKLENTCLEKYGVPYNCMRLEARNYSSSKSKINIDFEKKLQELNITYEAEFALGKYSYDFKINNYLIELNPTITHNSTFSIFSEDKILDRNYHKEKSKFASDHNYQCIQIFDWDNIDKILFLITLKDNAKKIYGRNCYVKQIDTLTSSNFLNTYHLQNNCKSDVQLGLFDKESNILLSVMTFGKSRYNKKYEYELIRYAFNSKVIGGAEKLFTYFIKTYNPKSIISYCDLSKFTGYIYRKFKMQLLTKNPNPSKHWYNIKTKVHITDNLLRQRGFDQLFKTNFGKNTSNEQLMLNYGFVEIYDCGQATYTINLDNDF